MTLTPQHLPTHSLHHAHDRDGNGYVSLDEATSILQSAPFNFPASKVGHLLLRLIDWQAPPTNQRAGWAEVGHLLAKFDKDGNGKLDIEEFADFYAEAKATCVSPSRCLSLPRSHFEQNTPPICSCASLPFPPSLPTPSFFPSLPRPFFAFSSTVLLPLLSFSDTIPVFPPLLAVWAFRLFHLVCSPPLISTRRFQPPFLATRLLSFLLPFCSFP